MPCAVLPNAPSGSHSSPTVTGDCVVWVGVAPPRGETDGNSAGGAGGCVTDALSDGSAAEDEGLGIGIGSDGAGAAGAGGCDDDKRGDDGIRGDDERCDEDGTNGGGTNRPGGAGSCRPSFGIGRRAGAAAISSTVAGLPCGADDAPSVTQPISATSNACPTSSATAMRTVPRTVRLTGTGSTRRTLWHPIDGSEVSGP